MTRVTRAPTRTSRPVADAISLEVEVSGRPLVLGLVADRVVEVIAFTAREIEPAPDIGVRWRSDYIRGVGHRDARFVILFDLANMFATDGRILATSSSVRAA